MSDLTRDQLDQHYAAALTRIDELQARNAELLETLKATRGLLTEWTRSDDLCAIDVVEDVLGVVNMAIAAEEQLT